jgi:hypothetical protein
MNLLRISAISLALVAGASSFALAGTTPTLTPAGAAITAKLEPPGTAMGMQKNFLATKGLSRKKIHSKGWMAAKGPKVVNIKKA